MNEASSKIADFQRIKFLGRLDKRSFTYRFLMIFAIRGRCMSLVPQARGSPAAAPLGTSAVPPSLPPDARRDVGPRLPTSQIVRLEKKISLKKYTLIPVKLLPPSKKKENTHEY